MSARVTSNAEDPANQRTFGGRKMSAKFYCYPRVRPSLAVPAGGPLILRADFTPVRAATPARSGEVLIIGAMGLGPVKPDVTIPRGVLRFPIPQHRK